MQATENRTIRIQDTALSQKNLIEISKEIGGEEWRTEYGSTEEEHQAGAAERAKSMPDRMGAVMKMLPKVIFSEQMKPCWDENNDNGAVGLKQMERRDVVEVIRNYLTWAMIK